MKRSLLMVLVLGFAFRCAGSAPLTVEQAVSLALERSKSAQLTRSKSAAAEAEADRARRLRYPRIEVFGLYGYSFHPFDVTVRRGALTPLLGGSDPLLTAGSLTGGPTPLPPADLTLLRGDRWHAMGGVTVTQPLSQLWRIASGEHAANAERSVAGSEGDRSVAQIRFAVEQLFSAILLADSRRVFCLAQVASAEQEFVDAERAVGLGEKIDEASLGLRAALAEAHGDLQRNERERERLVLQLADLIGRPGARQIDLIAELPEHASPPALEYWLARVAPSPDARTAAAMVNKARAGARAARQARIPEVSAYASIYRQGGLPLFPRWGGSAGLALRWEIFDFGRTRAETARNLAQQRAAEFNRERIEEETARQVRETYHELVDAGELQGVAESAVEYRRRAAALAEQSVASELASRSKALSAQAQLRKAEFALVGAKVRKHLALLKLRCIVGE